MTSSQYLAGDINRRKSLYVAFDQVTKRFYWVLPGQLEEANKTLSALVDLVKQGKIPVENRS